MSSSTVITGVGNDYLLVPKKVWNRAIESGFLNDDIDIVEMSNLPEKEQEKIEHSVQESDEEGWLSLEDLKSSCV